MDNVYQWIFYLTVFCITVLLGFVTTSLSIPLAHRFKMLDYPDKIKLHGRPVPYLGGTAIFIAFWTVTALLAHVIGYPEAYETLMRHLPQRFVTDRHIFTPMLTPLFAGSLIIVLLGVLDDRFVLKPLFKFAGQAAVAALLVNAGFEIQWFAGLPVIGKLLSLLWILTLVNAFNFIDSIDGHCGGIAFIACGFMFCISQAVYQPFMGLIFIVLGGAIFGFLPFNYDRARTFLGDNGSMFLGFMMSVLSLHTDYKSIQPNFMTLFVPLFVFGVPIYDLLSVVCVRLYRGVAPWKGDRNHFAHRLVRMGMDGHDAVLFAYIVGITTGLIALLSTQISSLRGHMLIVLLYCMILIVIAILEYHSIRHKDSKVRPDTNQGGL